MALYNSMLGYDQQPQQNQYLTSDPATNPEANTSWMNPTDSSSSGGGLSGGSVQPSTNPSQINSGTMLGSIASGGSFWNPNYPTGPAYGNQSNQTVPQQFQSNTGTVGQYMPQGYDLGKWNDPNKHDPKYDVGRVLSKYPPTPAGLQQAAPELQQLGFRVVGRDKIVGADGFPIDVGQGFSGVADNGGMGNWWWNPSNPGEFTPQMQQNQSMLAQNNQQNPFANNQMMDQIWKVLQGQRNLTGNQEFNPTGGSVMQQFQPQFDITSLLGIH